MTSFDAGSVEVLRGRVRPPAATGLRRVRLVSSVVNPNPPRLAVVVAPAGCGKTTLLAHIAEAATAAAWLTVDADLAQPSVLLAHLREAFATVPGFKSGTSWSTGPDLVNSLEEGLTGRTYLVLDDVQTLAGTPALDLVRLLLAHQPAALTVVIGSRSQPEVGISRYRLSATVTDIGPDDLRFRSWEVQQLFRSYHGMALPPGEAARLTQRTAGWAAALQLFHLATTGRSPTVWSELLSGSGAGRLTGRYLAEQLLEQLSVPLRDFVLRTSVLSRLSADRCDRLLGTSGSAALLAELDRSGLLGGDRGPAELAPGEYRFHSVLHTHLLDQLESRLGGAAARDLHRRAGAGWKDEGVYVEAVRSFCRAEDWDAVQAIFQVSGNQIAADRGSWLDLIPASMKQSDPWVALALARRLLADGSLAAAMAAYETAIANSAGLSGTDTAASELRALRDWISPPPLPGPDALHDVRLAFIDPRQVSKPSAPSPIRWCAYAFACIATGRLADAAEAFWVAMTNSADAPAVETLAVLGRAVTLTMIGDPASSQARLQANTIAAAVDLPVMERLGDGLIRLLSSPRGTQPTAVIDDVLAACRAVDDEWGEALLLFFATLRGLASATTSVDTAHRTAALLKNLQAPALATWASLAEAIAAAQKGEPWSQPQLDELRAAAADLGPGPEAIALVAIGSSTPTSAAGRQALQTANAMLDGSPLGVWMRRAQQSRFGEPGAAGARPADRSAPGHTLNVQVLGRFAVQLDGEPLELAGLRPLHRELLAVFCAHADVVLHRDRLVEWFWQDTDPARAQHSLQVAVSELRRLLNPTGDRSVPFGFYREGGGYRLGLAGPANCDARRMEQLIQQAAQAEQAGERARAADVLVSATDLYRGDLLAPMGYPEWVLPERDRLRSVVGDAFERLIQLYAAAGDHAGAVAAARSGLVHNRHRDVLWRQLVTSLQALDDRAAAAAAQRSYRELLLELGVPSTD